MSTTIHTDATAPNATAQYDAAAIMGGLYGDGIIGLKGAFTREWAETLREDIDQLFAEGLNRPGALVGRGPKRYYAEIHPERIRGFMDLVTHPWVVAVCRSVLGSEYKIVEIGFDVPLPGAMLQPWHRDFPAPEATLVGRRLNSLAFNITTIDVTEDMGPFEIAPGTQWDDGRDWNQEMFPPKEVWDRFAERGVRKYPQMGDVSCRSALTIHRGTTHPSPIARPVLVLGVDAPGAGHSALHDMMVTPAYYESIPEDLRRHLVCRVVDELVPVTQKHDIEGLVMGAD